MKKTSIKSHLKPYSIYGKRSTTINHAFASALAENDDYIKTNVNNALKKLGQDAEEDLICVYCDKPAGTWDHVFGLVKDKKYAGYGHVLGNLVPSCKLCNSKKGNRDWKVFLKDKPMKVKLMEAYLEEFMPEKMDQNDLMEQFPVEMGQFTDLKQEIFKLMQEADVVAERIRAQLKKRTSNFKLNQV